MGLIGWKRGRIAHAGDQQSWVLLCPVRLRIHRQTIINLEEIEEIESWFNRTFQVRLKNFRQTLAVSRRYAVKLKNRFT